MHSRVVRHVYELYGKRGASWWPGGAHGHTELEGSCDILWSLRSSVRARAGERPGAGAGVVGGWGGVLVGGGRRVPVTVGGARERELVSAGAEKSDMMHQALPKDTLGYPKNNWD